MASFSAEKFKHIRSISILNAAGLALFCSHPTQAQISLNDVVPPIKNSDENGVDLVTGKARFELPLISFGEGVGLHFRLDASTSYSGRSTPYLSRGAWNFLADAIGPFPWIAEYFEGSIQDMRVSAVFPQGAGSFWYKPQYVTTNPDGGKYYVSTSGPFTSRFFNSPSIPQGIYYADGTFGDESNAFWPQKPGRIFSKVIFPSGEIWTYNAQPSFFEDNKRIRSIVSNTGYAIQFEYLRETAPSNADQLLDWTTPVKISGYSKASIACDESLYQICAGASSSSNSVAISFDDANGHMNFALPDGNIYRIEFTKYSNGIAPNLWALTARGYVGVPSTRAVYGPGTPSVPSAVGSAITRGGKTWNYSVETNEGGEGPVQSYLTRTDPDGKIWTSSGYLSSGVVEFITDEIGRSSSQYVDPTFGYVGSVYLPGTNSFDIMRDNRSNVTQVVENSVYGSGQPPIVLQTADFPANCVNPKTCNKPVWTKDAKSSQTDYTYDPAHGGVLTETGPAVNGVRPQLRYEYSQRYAWTKGSGGAFVQSSTPIWLKTREEYCRTTAAVGSGCAGGALDEVVTEFDYGPNSGPNNLLLRGVTVTAMNGSGSLETLRTCYAYDAFGRQISKTEPQANLSVCP